jgi:hypothetical protein
MSAQPHFGFAAMTPYDDLKHSPEIHAAVLAGRAFFAENKKTRLFSHYLGTAKDGSWTFLVLSNTGEIGAFRYSPPAESVTVEIATQVFNHREHGQEFLSKAAAETFRRVRAEIAS